MVDTHVQRLSRRLGLTEETDPEKIERDLLALVPREDWTRLVAPADPTTAAQVCKARKPECGRCVVNDALPLGGGLKAMSSRTQDRRRHRRLRRHRRGDRPRPRRGRLPRLRRARRRRTAWSGSPARSAATALPLDVTDPASVEAFVAAVLARSPGLHLLVNNAGGAFGVDRVEESIDERWRAMFETNVLGTVRMTRALLPALVASGDGHVVNMGSIAGFETYAGGSGYTAAKHAQRALTRTLRLELLGRPVRVTDIAPGLVETEFSLVRFAGDAERAQAPSTAA